MESTKDELSREITEVASEVDTISTQLTNLKATLYAKFGNVSPTHILSRIPVVIEHVLMFTFLFLFDMKTINLEESP